MSYFQYFCAFIKDLTFYLVLFGPSLIQIGPVVVKKKMKMLNVYRQMTDGQEMIRKAHFSFNTR